MISVARLDNFPPLLDQTDGRQLFYGAAWYRCVLAHAMPAGSRAMFLTASADGAPRAVLALRRQGRQLESLTTPYSCLFGPILAEGLSAPVRAGLCLALARACRDWPVTRLDCIDPDDPDSAALIAAGEAAGLKLRRFAHFGNWHERVAGLDWAHYLAARPSALRNTIRRRAAAAAREGYSFTVLAGPERLEVGIAAYDAIYASSWKQQEPFPAFNRELMRAFAPLGMLRLGLLYLRERPVAAQIWLIERGTALVAKLAHDAAFHTASPGTVLTAHMLRYLLDEEHVAEIDFGRGDDAYKRAWAGERRQRMGLLLINPRHPLGLAALGRQAVGDIARRFYRRQKSVSPG